jgi:hypothetical protein
MTQQLEDPVAETRRILDVAAAEGVLLRAIGGVGVALRAPVVARMRPARTYHDIDLVARPPRGPVERLLVYAGYEPAHRFNTLNGSERLLFYDPSGRRIDVFLDVLRMCHVLPFANRLAIDPLTLTLADLLLSKLQIVELTDRDVVDITALLADHPITDDDGGIGLRRIEDVCTTDWGWWRTVDGNLRRLIERWREADAAWSDEEAFIVGTATARAGGLRQRLLTAPKPIAWRLRASIGERVRWYDEPEEVR